MSVSNPQRERGAHDVVGAASTRVKRRFIAPHREGGQAQFVPKPVVPSKRNALSPLLDRMRKSLDGQHSIAELASSAGMSERTFLRRFKAATGTSPNEWLTEARLQHARELLERTDLLISSRTGVALEPQRRCGTTLGSGCRRAPSRIARGSMPERWLKSNCDSWECRLCNPSHRARVGPYPTIHLRGLCRASVLQRQDGIWKIRALHSSSRAPKADDVRA